MLQLITNPFSQIHGRESRVPQEASQRGTWVCVIPPPQHRNGFNINMPFRGESEIKVKLLNITQLPSAQSQPRVTSASVNASRVPGMPSLMAFECLVVLKYLLKPEDVI